MNHRRRAGQRGGRPVQWVGQRRLILSMGVAWMLFGFTAAQAAAAGLSQEAVQQGPTIWPALLPLLAAAASVERTIEMGWNYIEWFLMRYLKWRPSDLKKPSYLEFKSGTSLLAGIVLGILVVNYSSMRLLAYLQPLIPQFLVGDVQSWGRWDVIITGVVVGAGSKPAHDILGLITQLKNFAGNSALRQREQAGAALAEGILKLGQADAPYNIDVPGLPGEGAAARDIGPAAVQARQARIDAYAKTIHDNLYINS